MINGFIIIDKPAGITSHDVVSRVRRILGTRKVGHTGTLDPFATGVLPVAVNDGTKAIPFLDEGFKCYETIMRLGVVTDTLDITGKVQRQADCSMISCTHLEAALTHFTGHISQIPPMFSAIKQNGQPLYKLARLGQEVERSARRVEIKSLELLSFNPPLATLRINCSRGTYIRSLADDIGTELGCGATLQELRRISSGTFDIASAVSLEGLEETCLQGSPESLIVSPMAALTHLADIPLSDVGLAKLHYGRSPEWKETLLTVSLSCTAPVPARLSHAGVLVAVAILMPGGADSSARIVLKRVFV